MICTQHYSDSKHIDRAGRKRKQLALPHIAFVMFLGSSERTGRVCTVFSVKQVTNRNALSTNRTTEHGIVRFAPGYIGHGEGRDPIEEQA